MGVGSYLAVAAGGAIGSALRLGLQEWAVAHVGQSFPWGTLGINVLGSFLMGLFAVILVERLALDPVWRLFLVIGMLGGFTTFSTFSLEVVHMLDGKAWMHAIGYMGATLLGCVLATAGALYGARLLLA